MCCVFPLSYSSDVHFDEAGGDVPFLVVQRLPVLQFREYVGDGSVAGLGQNIDYDLVLNQYGCISG